MPTLHLGVIDVPYANVPRAKGAKRNSSNKTTGDVAEILESKYGLFSFFYDNHTQAIGDQLAESMQGALENLLMGAPVSTNPFGQGESAIDGMFRTMIDQKELDGKVAGVPTQAALNGVSHRFKNPYKKRPPRPSFLDTGLLQASFKSWVD